MRREGKSQGVEPACSDALRRIPMIGMIKLILVLPAVFFVECGKTPPKSVPPVAQKPPAATQSPAKDKCDFSKFTSLRARASHGSSMLSFPKPEYPPEAKERGIQGRVAVLLLVNVRTAAVEQTCVLEAEAALATAAQDVALLVKFSPYSQYL